MTEEGKCLVSWCLPECYTISHKSIKKRKNIIMNKEKYKELFTYLGMKQKDFAQKYGVQASNLSDIVNGRAKHLPIDVILKLNEEHGFSIKWLI